ncbi:hypothetical protein FNV43_RR17748 [Rhamnella rubrinervis]|uniref:BHLH domain-containing protein n=1 Tax=Rhamnella rubrinervis TaxID=2594499 RepID=A0A8K0E4V4_9ROSA|nr:hypothetical protein FNV43_RR17748 [Rhamnella rubrinervis]
MYARFLGLQGVVDMGFLLKEALKTLCGRNQWSYAVFWKIGCQNPKLLIWEECHCEPSKFYLPMRISGTGSDELSFGEWERCLASSEIGSSELGIHARDRVFALINKMLTNNQVNIVGEGIVGRAAFTGNHQWILSNNYSKDAHPPEVLNEMHHQFSAGMQTVAVIPVLPHGVVQLGSSMTIMENIGFVNDVKRLIMQLGCVRGALLSDNFVVKDSVEKIGVPVTVGNLVPMDLSGLQKMINSSCMVNSYSQQSNSFPAPGLVDQPFNSLVKDIRQNQQTIGSTFETPANMTFPTPHDNSCKLKFSSLMKSNFPYGGQLKDENVGAEVIPSNSNEWFNHQASPCNSRSGLNGPGFSQSGTSQGSLIVRENKILSGCFQDNVRENGFSPNNFNMPHLGTSGNFILDHNNRCGTATFQERSQIHGGMSSPSEQILVPRSFSNPSGAFRTEKVSSSSVADEIAQVQMLSKVVDDGQFIKEVKLTRNGLAPKEQRYSELFQALNNSFVCPDQHVSSSQCIPDFVHDFQNLDNKIQCPGSSNAKLEDVFIQHSSGDDLFDILGLDFKNDPLSCHLNNLLSEGLDGNTQNMGENMSTPSNIKDASFNLRSASDGITDCGIFSGGIFSGTDHLLDAVVSKAHGAAKQSSDDSLSCRTTLTRISSSSVPSSSLTYGCNSMSNHKQGDAFRLPESLPKAGMVKASSFKSGCIKDDAGNCSQTTSVYGSQISSWVEQGHSVKRDNSVSTAYSKKTDEFGKSHRKRLKPGENPKPRPKDRQMIQDRVKELREIVPNGAKCSIDALLERTIKHMLFLQSVTKHADKLKQTGESKIVNKEGGLLLKDNFEGGATWAFEVDSQSMVCPIIVEDLNPPRQMLVEMLCEERGFFLEIADLIRGMGLTILKGVMEARNDKIWARFAVEANRDVTRLEIFMSLVHLLEQAAKAGASSADAIENNTLMVQHSFPQAAPIPATGRPS